MQTREGVRGREIKSELERKREKQIHREREGGQERDKELARVNDRAKEREIQGARQKERHREPGMITEQDAKQIGGSYEIQYTIDE